jgi:SAM-dependent methyltransferase
MKRVSGPKERPISFINKGFTASRRLRAIALKHGVKLDSPQLRILDWGVGCGRVIRHFEDLPTSDLWGVDIDEDNVAWCNGNLRSKSFLTNLSPPTPLADATCDLIYSCSVLSHLTEESTLEWLAEMQRLLSADGIGLLSFNGTANAATYLSRRPREFVQMLQTGFYDNDINHDLDGFIGNSEYYRATFCSDQWWQTAFSKYFELVSVEPGVVSNHQNIAVVRKK